MKKPLNMLLVLGSAAALVMVGSPLTAQAAAGVSVNVTSASPTFPFSQNKQNEPAIAVDANHNNIVVAGSNDEIDEQACSSQFDNPCPFTPGVGVSGVYFSFNSGQSWSQPTYQGGVQNTGARTSPDVSFLADRSIGVAVYDSYDDTGGGPWTSMGGTSFSAKSF